MVSKWIHHIWRAKGLSYAKFRVHEARHALDLVDLVERFHICCVEGHDLEVLRDPGGCDGLGKRSDAAGD
jgi:hypothetical protein